MNRATCFVLSLMAGCSRPVPVESPPLDPPVAVVAQSSDRGADFNEPHAVRRRSRSRRPFARRAVSPDTPALNPSSGSRWHPGRERRLLAT